jgi:hypothetical protein
LHQDIWVALAEGHAAVAAVAAVVSVGLVVALVAAVALAAEAFWKIVACACCLLRFFSQ